MKKLLFPFSLLVVASMVLAACGGNSAAEPTLASATEEIATATSVAEKPVTPTQEPTETPIPTNTPKPQVLQDSIYTIEPNRFQIIGSKIGNLVAYDFESGDVVVIGRGDYLKVNGGKDGKRIGVTIFSNSQLEVAGFVDRDMANVGRKYMATLLFAGIADGWDHDDVPAGWSWYHSENQLSHRLDYEQDLVENARNGLPTNTFVQVTCQPYENDPGNLPDGMRYNQRQVFQVLAVNGAVVDIVKVCGDRGLSGIASVWANEFSLNDRAEATGPEAQLALMSDALSMYMSPAMNGDIVVTTPAGQAVMMADQLLDGASNFARFTAGADSRGGWPTAPEEWLVK